MEPVDPSTRLDLVSDVWEKGRAMADCIVRKRDRSGERERVDDNLTNTAERERGDVSVKYKTGAEISRRVCLTTSYFKYCLINLRPIRLYYGPHSFH